MVTENFREQLKQKGLKITPQRTAIYEAIVKLKNHPTVENIIDYFKKIHPNISVGTIYKVLDSFVDHNLLKKVKSDKGGMRYDAVLTHHHHLYSSTTDRIEDYKDDELDELINEYFNKKKIEDFTIQEIKLQITGNFSK